MTTISYGINEVRNDDDNHSTVAMSCKCRPGNCANKTLMNHVFQ